MEKEEDRERKRKSGNNVHIVQHYEPASEKKQQICATRKETTATTQHNNAPSYCELTECGERKKSVSLMALYKSSKKLYYYGILFGPTRRRRQQHDIDEFFSPFLSLYVPLSVAYIPTAAALV